MSFSSRLITVCTPYSTDIPLFPDNRTDVWLANTDDSFRYGMDFVVIHVLLLLIDFVVHRKDALSVWVSASFRSHKLLYEFSVPADILELLFDRLTVLFAGTFLHLARFR